VAWAAALAAACSSTPAPSGSQAPSATPGKVEPLTPVALPKAEARGIERAIVAFPVVPHLGPRPDGPSLRSEADGRETPLEFGTRVSILEAPTNGPGGDWVRVWVQPDEDRYPGDFYAWVPVKIDGQATLEPIEPATCPSKATIDTLAPLVQQDRFLCLGATTVTFDARSGQLGRVPYYDVDPAWYGIYAGPPIEALYNPGAVAIGPGAILNPTEATFWLEIHVPPDVLPVPLGFYVRVTGQFDHQSAAGCRRTDVNAVAGRGLPVEAAADSVRWCREQFVVTGWQPLLGPEGRPVDPAAPQLHRREFRPPPGVLVGCRGVGMPPLTIRIDPSQVDPVWVEWGPGRRSLAVFSDDFRIALDPPRIVGANGVILLDGEVLDPDRGKPGLVICPGGDTISFDLAITKR
jgi:hypothetical protein